MGGQQDVSEREHFPGITWGKDTMFAQREKLFTDFLSGRNHYLLLVAYHLISIQCSLSYSFSLTLFIHREAMNIEMLTELAQGCPDSGRCHEL